MNPLSPVSQHLTSSSLQQSASSTATMDQPKPSKAPVVRGARACTVCRTAKMKCVGAEDGEPCQRCKRSGVECVFEKHRRGRKPGSKLSEASKMLRRLEKGLNSAKLKSQSHETTLSQLASDARLDRFPNNELPPLNLPPDFEGGARNRSATRGSDEDDDDPDKNTDGIFPAQLIKKENQLQRNSFFKTILNPENMEPHSRKGSQAANASSGSSDHGQSFGSRTPTRSPSAPPICDPANTTQADSIHLDPWNGCLKDPIAAGLITIDQANVFFDAFFLRLNPFVNLFDPALHSMTYVRSRCPFLFTAIIMACCKFFASSLYLPMKKFANDFAVRAFADNWKRVEVVQAFACLVYWKEPDDTRPWTYIGYACRMAVELELNRYVGDKHLINETDLQWRERRNRERTYLVLFVHDRSLSTQTGRQWMLNEDELVRHSSHWHEEVGGVGTSRRPEDVILAAFVQLRLIASGIACILYARNSSPGSKEPREDVNHSELLRECNYRLNNWMEHWKVEMEKAGGEKFHIAFLRFFWLYVCLFLNSFGVQPALSAATRLQPDVEALHVCYRSALENLQSVVDDFAAMATLRYGQDSITVMTAYCAVFLLKLLRSPNTAPHLPTSATEDIHKCILRTADAYDTASDQTNASTSAAHHARFLKGLIARDIFECREQETLKGRRDEAMGIPQGRGSWAQPDVRVPSAPSTNGFTGTNGISPDAYPQQAQSIITQPPTVPSQLSQSNPQYMFPTPSASTSPPTGPPHILPQSYPMREVDYHSPESAVRTSSNDGLSNGYGYAVPNDPSPTPVVPSQSQPPSMSTSTLSDADYSMTMFRNIGEMGFDLYPTPMYPQHHQQTRQQGWVNAATAGDSVYSVASHSSDGYGYQQQQQGYGRYQHQHGFSQGMMR